MLFTKYYLHSEISRSDVVGFVIVFIAYGLNVTGIVSKYLGIPVTKNETKNDDAKTEEKKDDTKAVTTTPTTVQKEPEKK